MKGKHFFILIILTCVFMLTSCREDITYHPYADYVYIDVSVFSGTGDNILDNNAVACILDREISVKYKGENYILVKEPQNDVITSQRPVFLNPILVDGVIRIGRFSGGKNGISTVLLQLGKAEYIITLDNFYEFDNKKNKEKITRKFYLNDELVDGPTDSNVGKIKIVLNPADI